MDFSFSLPDDLARRLEQRWGNLSERAREALVAEAYREDELTLGEVGGILGHQTRMETERVLQAHDIYLDYDEQDLAEDVRAARAARS